MYQIFFIKCNLKICILQDIFAVQFYLTPILFQCIFLPFPNKAQWKIWLMRVSCIYSVWTNQIHWYNCIPNVHLYVLLCSGYWNGLQYQKFDIHKTARSCLQEKVAKNCFGTVAIFYTFISKPFQIPNMSRCMCTKFSVVCMFITLNLDFKMLKSCSILYIFYCIAFQSQFSFEKCLHCCCWPCRIFYIHFCSSFHCTDWS